MPYDVRTPVYQGPFDLLLHLICREEVDLWDVSLSGIVDAYVLEIERIGTIDLDVATEFLVVAATLVELKCRRLLPGPDDVELDEELALFEERDLLLARLLECKTFRNAAAAMSRLAAAAANSHPRTAGLEPRFLAITPDLLAGLGPLDLQAAWLSATTPKPVPQVDLDHVAPVRVSVAEVAEELAASLPGTGRRSFRAITSRLATRLDVIVHFLALLELYKQGRVDLDQAESFGELTVAWVDGPPASPGAYERDTVDSYDG
ncbi:MAG: segregation/condensation protein A [Actinomycetota bacterium]|nr:segregation/condensation protein A [Actinomycetota bacterium]